MEAIKTTMVVIPLGYILVWIGFFVIWVRIGHYMTKAGIGALQLITTKK